MIATGTLYLSKQAPVASVAADGVFGLTMLAYDRIGHKQVEPWRLIWIGADARDFYQANRHLLEAGVPLDVTASVVRLMSGTARHAGPEIHAHVQTLSLPTAY